MNNDVIFQDIRNLIQEINSIETNIPMLRFINAMVLSLKNWMKRRVGNYQITENITIGELSDIVLSRNTKDNLISEINSIIQIIKDSDFSEIELVRYKLNLVRSYLFNELTFDEFFNNFSSNWE